MIAIYDFDGTLTPFAFPQYEIVKKHGYTDYDFMDDIKELFMSGKVTDVYEGFYQVFRNMLEECGEELSLDNVCSGAENVKLNKGVVDYFLEFQSSKTGIKHFIITSGIKEYVNKTKVGELVDKVFGVTFEEKDGKLGDVSYLLTDKEKVNVIKKIEDDNPDESIIYFGDGLTDYDAFKYVHDKGGKCVFIAANPDAKGVYLKMQDVIDKCFDADFSIDSELYKYVKEVMLGVSKRYKSDQGSNM